MLDLLVNDVTLFSPVEYPEILVCIFVSILLVVVHNIYIIYNAILIKTALCVMCKNIGNELMITFDFKI